MSRNVKPTPETSPEPAKPMGCHVCGKPFKNFPEHLVVISNGNDATAMLHVQLSVKVKKSDDCTEPLPDYACAPICIPCVHMIVSGAFRGLAAKAALENPEQN